MSEKKNRTIHKSLDDKTPPISKLTMFNTIMENSIESIYFKDKDFRFIYVNKNKAIRHGIKSPEEMVGKTDFDFISKDIAKKILKVEKSILATGRPIIDKIEKLTRLDGRLTWASSSKYPFYDKNGNIAGIWGISRDITEYEFAKEALKASEAKQKAMITNIPDIIAVLDQDGVIRFTSPNVKKVFGWLPRDLIGKKSEALIHPDDQEQIQTEFYSLLEKDGSIKVAEFRCKCKDGGYKYVELTAINLLNDNNINGVLINYHDITERKRVEDELKESENLYRTFINASHDLIYLKDDLYRHLVANQPLQEFFWKTNSEIIGKTDFELMPVSAAEQCRKGDEQAIVTNSVFISDENIGDKVYESLKFPVPLFGNKTGVGAFIRDITERKNNEEKLLINEKRYKTITQTSMDGFWVVNEKGEIIEANDAYCEMSGYTKEELLAMKITDLECSESKEEIAFHIEKIIRTGQDKFESSHRRADGTIINIYNSVTYMEDERLMICFFNDITERIKREEELKYIGYHDILTGLYNRSYFEKEIKRLDADRQSPLSVIIGDINGLKLINDSFGHDIGDKTISEVANIIKSSCRESDIIARIGGDEFCILLPKSDEGIAQKICKRIYSKCEQYKNIGTVGVLFISISLGSMSRTIAQESIEVIIREAEAAMYRHKLLETRSLRSSVVSSIISTLQERYTETNAHSDRMKKLCRATGIALGMSDSMLDDLELLAALHDIGKISISDKIINKKSKLTNDEMKEMKRHTEIGYNITQATIEFQRISEYILAHHEKWDGSGYPRKFKGEEIPLLSRIISVVDSYDAMTNDRPYRKALPKEYAVNEIKACAGTQFDPKIARVFVEKVLGGKW